MSKKLKNHDGIWTLKQPYTVTVLDISTGHITENDTVLLEKDDCPITGYPFGPKDDPYGHIVYINESKAGFENSMKLAKKYGFSEAFIKICEAARLKLKCAYVRFDRDGALYDLPTFNW